MDDLSFARSGRVSSIGCLLVLTFWFSVSGWLYPSGPIFLWSGSRWKFFGVLSLLGAPIWRGLVWCRPTTAGDAWWSYVTEPWNPGYTGVWHAPKCWKFYSWRIHLPYSRVAVILLRGIWLTFSGWPPTPHPVAHQQSRERVRNVDIYWYRPPDKSFFLRPLCLLKTLLWCFC